MIINKKGQLFGIINIFDLITILLVIALIIGAFYKIKGGDLSLGSNDTTTIEYRVQSFPNYEDFFKQLKVGDKLGEDKRFLDGEITSIEITDYYRPTESQQGEYVMSKHPLYKQAYVTVKANAEKKGPIIKVGSQEVRPGLHYYLRTKTSEFSVLILDVKVAE